MNTDNETRKAILKSQKLKIFDDYQNREVLI